MKKSGTYKIRALALVITVIIACSIIGVLNEKRSYELESGMYVMPSLTAIESSKLGYCLFVDTERQTCTLMNESPDNSPEVSFTLQSDFFHGTEILLDPEKLDGKQLRFKVESGNALNALDSYDGLWWKISKEDKFVLEE